MKMRIGQNEKALLLYLLQQPEGKAGIKKFHHRFTYSFPLYSLKSTPAVPYMSASQISQSLSSLDRKGLIKKWSRQGFPGASVLLDSGKEMAMKYRDEIDEYIKVWGPLVKQDSLS